MKVFIIENGISKDIFVVRNKGRFCEKFNLTPRLLDYTIKGASATRYQEYHKNYRIVDKLEFIEAKEGDRVLWDSGVTGYCVREDGKHFKDKPVDRSVELENELEATRVELKKVLKQKQKIQDTLNLNKKLAREQYRYENFMDAFKDSCKKMIEYNLHKFDYVEDSEYVYDPNGTAILTLSDLHFGQRVEESNNYFDSEVADIRLSRIFKQFEQEIEMRGIQNVAIFFLGDLIHAQSVSTKPDMKLSGEMPEVQSSIQCFIILSKYIDRLVAKYNVKIAGIVGNESRFSNHMLPSNLRSEAKNSMDVVIYEFFKQRYLNAQNVDFLNNGDEIETVVSVDDKNILLNHGYDLNHSNLEKSIIELRTRMEKSYGEIDFVTIGHIHSSYIGDKFARNSSLVGSNAYSNRKGYIESTVSQNMIIVDKNGFKVFSLKA